VGHLRKASKRTEVTFMDEPYSIALSARIRPLLVVDSTPNNPGWRDIDRDKERRVLFEEDLTNAEGRFYVRIVDGFGRKTPFDLRYQC
jgi:hypothetical protein